MTTPPEERLRWLYLDLNSYFASVEQQERPELRGRPVAVVPTMADSTCCIAASYEAKAFGVTTGTRVADARLMCPGLTFITGRHGLYVQYHHAILKAVNECLPVEHVLSIDEMAGRLYGREQSPAGAAALSREVKATINRRVGAALKCSIGLAPNRFLAKVAAEMKKPDGLVALRPMDLPHALHPLALRDIPGVGPGMAERIRRAGVFSVRELCLQSKEAMRSIWGGVVGERYWAWLRGEDLSAPAGGHHSISHSHVLEPALRTTAGAYQVAKRLTDKAALRLRKMGWWAAGFSLHLRFGTGRGKWEAFAKVDEAQDTAVFLSILSGFWKDVPPEKPIQAAVVLAPLVPPSKHTPSLFDGGRRDALAGAMDRINDRYGKQTAYYANLFDVPGKAPTRIAFQRVPEIGEFEEGD